MKSVALNSSSSGFAHRFFSCLAPAPKTRIAAPEIVDVEKRGTILVVDDDEVVLKTTATKLESAGYTVIRARDCAEAIGAVGRQRPDVIVLDVSFPPDVAAGGMAAWDGLQLMYWMRGLENTKGTRFIIMSGSLSADLTQRAFRSGAIACFEKPLDYERLLHSIESGVRDGWVRTPGRI